MTVGAAILLVLAGLILLFFNRLATGNLILARGDVYLYFYPYWQAAADAFSEGRVPLWNPHLFMGAPFVANSQVGFFYPLNWPLWLLLETPYAVSASIILHLFIAGSGAFLAGRRCLSLSRPAAGLAAVLFALGGYVTSQVEHVNQVQGIAWLPWYFVVLCAWLHGKHSRRQIAKTIAGVAILLSLQILSGHTQTVFISMMAVLIWFAVILKGRHSNYTEAITKKQRVIAGIRDVWSLAWPIVAGVLLALGIAAIQIVPTLELGSHSLRQGGLPVNEVLSFSLQPIVIAQALLPSYDHLIFSEYVTFIPIGALLLAVIGLRGSWRLRQARPFIVLLIVGLLLALGRFNPLYHVLAHLPGFNLFRAPARWSVLYALGIAFLAAMGWQSVSGTEQSIRHEAARRKHSKALSVGVILVLLLVAWAVASVALSEVLPLAPETVVEMPSRITLAAWLIELGLSAALILLMVNGRATGAISWLMLAGLIVALFFSTRVLPYNHPTTPRAFFEQRAPVSRLVADQDCPAPESPCPAVRGRILGLSDIFFDLGDQAELDGVFGQNFGEEERFDYIVASKQKEVLGPNLPLTYGLFSVDGFDGGILPLENYARLLGLILPAGEETFDGRLREQLDTIPDGQWLDLFATEYIITDKVGDQWRQDIFFDMKHPTWVTSDNGPVEVGFVPNYEATDLYMIASGEPGGSTVVTESGERWLLEPRRVESDLWQFRLPQATSLDRIVLHPCPEPGSQEFCYEWLVEALALSDSRDGSFRQIVAGDYRLVYSGDVKIYQRLDPSPRAVLLYDWQFAEDSSNGVSMMNTDEFNPENTGIVIGRGPASPGSGNGHVVLTNYEPEHIMLYTESDQPALLLLKEANYPGWQATVDGMPAEIVETDILFQGIFVPSGIHVVELVFRPVSVQVGRIISLFSLLVLFVLVTYILTIPAIERIRQA